MFVETLARARIGDDGIGYRGAPAQHPTHRGSSVRQGYIRAAQVPHKARYGAKPLSHQAEEIGVVQPSLQEVGTQFAKHVGKSQQSEWMRCAPSDSEGSDLDAGGGERCP